MTLEKLVSQENQPKLRNVLWKVHTQDLEQGEAPFTSLEDFYISPEFYFDQEGIHFVYPPYELNSYAEGERTLDLYWGQTEIELLNPEYVKPWLK
ncbi:RsiV family protein [Avibacterium gallinarum]|uniref:RsiV family protein n=1 Tax=Avibacterium gallinarum TaxID=755 RepID=UPI003BF7D66E